MEFYWRSGVGVEINPRDYGYDIESYPNIFTITVIHALTGTTWAYEISTRQNQIVEILQLLWALSQQRARMVGFNNEAYDYPVIHYIMQVGYSITVEMIYQKSISIIFGERFSSIVWDSDRYIEQLDLFKIHHFDNKAKSTSLKMIEFNMQSDTIEDLPYEPGTYLESDQMDVLLQYNYHDTIKTVDFYIYTLPAIAFREELSQRFNRNFINYNDTKIGKSYLIMKLEEAGVPCYEYVDGRRQPRQTIRYSINIGEIILPYIKFKHPSLQRLRDWFSQQVIYQTKGAFDDVSVTVDGFTFDFGLGGLHGSIDSATVKSNDEYQIIDLDVTSYYPSVSIANRFYPEHLTEIFCDEYAGLKTERVNHPKKSVMNAALKLGLNGGFGDSNNVYSPLYDPKFTMSITVNGQLSLCMLAEELMRVQGMKMIQANTDGVTIYCPREWEWVVKDICQEWERLTGLELERNDYSRMFIRDVNNYLAEGTDGTIKRKGAYAYETPMENPNTRELEWHKNHSARIIAKAAESALIDDENIESYIKSHPEPLDFMLRTKVPRGSKLMLDDRQLQNITRYYISNQGGSLRKVMPPVKGKEVLHFDVYQMPDGQLFYARLKADYTKAEKKGYIWLRKEDRQAPDRNTDINKGWLVTPCNDLRGVTEFDFNYQWYIEEARKLVDPLKSFEVN